MRSVALPGTAQFAVAAVLVLVLDTLVHASVLNPVTSLDPWFYTGSFTNFSYLYATFHQGYWVGRLPWIVPGIVANWLFPPLAAFFVLHIVFFVGGALFVYLLVRRFYGHGVAFAIATLLMLLPLWFDAHSTDYVDGPTMTFLFGAAYFGLDTRSEGRARMLRLGLAGFFAAAAFGTQIFVSILLFGLICVYAIVVGGDARLRRVIPRDVGAAVAGALVLLLSCGIVSRAYGGEFLFFMPSWRAGESVQVSRWHRAGSAWMLGEPQLLIPFFVLVLLAVLLVRRGRAGLRATPQLRFAVASALFLLYVTALLTTWELAFSGDFFEVSYYFSLFLVPIVPALAACLYLLVSKTEVERWSAPTVAAVLAALPIVLIFGLEIGPTGRGASLLVLILMAAVVCAAALGVPRRLGVAAVALFVVTCFSVSYAGAGGNLTHVFGGGKATFGPRRATLGKAMQLERFMARNHLQTNPPPVFWYDGKTHRDLNGIQSTYLWGITWFGRNLPRFTPANKRALDNRKPPYVVMLCGNRSCSNAPSVLERAGYTLQPVANGTLGSGAGTYWVKAFKIPKFFPHPIRDFYTQGQSSFVAAPTGRALTTVSFAGLPDGWETSSPLRRSGGAPTLTTTETPWNYEVKSPRMQLPAGTYQVYLRGKVVRGGLDLGVLDAGASTWIEQRTYWHGQRGFANRWMATPFMLSQPTDIQLILSNWVPRRSPSIWQLRELRLVRTG